MRNGLFYDWVNPKLDLWILIIMSILIGFTSGLSTSISIYMVSDMAINPADAAMCSYAYMAGMAISFAAFGRLRNYFSSKQIYICVCLLLIFLNFVLTQTDSSAIVILATFLIGGIRLTGSLLVVVNLIPILMPNGGQRFQMYSVYYPISLLTSPISGMLQALIANNFGWHFAFHLSNLMLFIALLMGIVLIKPNFSGRRIPLWKFDWFSLFLISGWMLTFSYTLSYGRNEDWFVSDAIRITTLMTIVFLCAFLLRNTLLRHRIMEFDILKLRNVKIGLILIFTLCVFFSLTTPLNTWMNISFRNDPLENAQVNIYPVYGYVIGALICYAYYRYYRNYKVILLFTLACYVLSTAMLYLMVDTQTEASMMALPLIIRGIAIISSYMTIGLYLVEGLSAHQLTMAAMILIFVRTFLGPAVFGGAYSNWVYYRTVQLTDKLASWSDQADPVFQQRFQGVHTPNADVLSAYKVLQVQATLGSVKELLGWTCIVGIGMIIVLLFLPIYKRMDRNLFNWRKYENAEEIATTVTA